MRRVQVLRLRQTAVGVGVGGNPNPYTYPVDPINDQDLTGQWGWSNLKKAYKAVVTNKWVKLGLAVCGSIAWGGLGTGCNLAQTVIACTTASHTACAQAAIVLVVGAVVGGAASKYVEKYAAKGLFKNAAGKLTTAGHAKSFITGQHGNAAQYIAGGAMSRWN
jgi:hypothetical protein